MNTLLPERNELLPITNDRTTFYECGFNSDFDSLTFQKKLEVVNNIIRQTILPTCRPNAVNHTETLIGNCHTAALASIEYLKYLNIGKNHRYVMGRIRPFEPDDITTTHALVLVDDEYGNTYQFDATPYVGYKFGTVSPINDERYYLEYVEVDDDVYKILYEFRNLIFLDYNGLLNESHIEHYKKILFEAMNYDILNGYVSHCAKLLSNYETNKYDKDKLMKMAFSYDLYDKMNTENGILRERKKSMQLKQISIWREELEDLKNGNANFKRQLELAQMIIQEMKFIDPSYERYLYLNDKRVRFSHITPRFLYEENLTTIMIKPSAYLTNTNSYIEEEMCRGASLIAGKYTCNLALKTSETGIKPMVFSHTLGEEHIRSMNGTSEILLVDKDVEELCKTKRTLREELGKDMYFKQIMWYDGKDILWHPFVTNYIHSADNPSESSLHYLIGYPEHQLMTRFMYPNKKLEKRK